MITKKKLESCDEFEEPKIHLEQYITPSNIAAEVINLAYLKGDIAGKSVYDLGCGTGKLAIGCTYGRCAYDGDAIKISCITSFKIYRADSRSGTLIIYGEKETLKKLKTKFIMIGATNISRG